MKLTLSDIKSKLKLGPNGSPVLAIILFVVAFSVTLMILGGDPDGKIKKLMDYTDRGGDVSDPWYSDRFDVAFDDIYEGCRALLRALEDGE